MILDYIKQKKNNLFIYKIWAKKLVLKIDLSKISLENIELQSGREYFDCLLYLQYQGMKLSWLNDQKTCWKMSV